MASNVNTSTSGDGIHVVGLQSYKKIEALMQSTANGQVVNYSLFSKEL
jgi:Arf-GAP/coiled-coil/ANK repeat/PH domain-containing protein